LPKRYTPGKENTGLKGWGKKFSNEWRMKENNSSYIRI
jgi:hypothetical protein